MMGSVVSYQAMQQAVSVSCVIVQKPKDGDGARRKISTNMGFYWVNNIERFGRGSFSNCVLKS